MKDPATGEVVELRCTYDPATRGGDAPDGRKVKGTIHWVSAAHALPAEVRLYDRLFTTAEPGRRPGGEGLPLEPEPRLARREGAALASSRRSRRLKHGDVFQFERLGYFVVDPDSAPGPPRLQPLRLACATRGRRSRRRPAGGRDGPRAASSSGRPSRSSSRTSSGSRRSRRSRRLGLFVPEHGQGRARGVLLPDGPPRRARRPASARAGAAGRRPSSSSSRALLWGCLDEFHQSFVPGRDVEIADVVADTAGVALAVAVGERFSEGQDWIARSAKGVPGRGGARGTRSRVPRNHVASHLLARAEGALPGLRPGEQVAGGQGFEPR